MQTKSPELWSKQEQELQADEASRTFLKFFTTWFTAAEDHISLQFPLTKDNPKLAVGDAIRCCLHHTETDLGALSMEWIGQMLLLAREHWRYGAKMVNDLTHLEKRMMDQMEAIKIAALQEEAATL